MAMSIGPRQELLLPVRPSFLWFTLLVALVVNLLPWEGAWTWLKPDFVSLALLFWIVREPRLVGFGVAFGLGLAMDVAQASLFGQHALAYTVVAFGATLLRRRLRMFSTDKHILQILPILLTAQAVILLVRLAGGAAFDSGDQRSDSHPAGDGQCQAHHQQRDARPATTQVPPRQADDSPHLHCC